MKTSILKFSFITVLLLTVISGSAQTKSTIHIKSMTIENGDTIVKEQTIEGDGNSLISDTLFDNNQGFLYFNHDFNEDSNFNDNFSQSFGNEMDNFLKQFDVPSDSFFGQGFDFLNRSFPMNIDSMFGNTFPPDYSRGDTNNESFEQPQTHVWFPYYISCENMISVFGPTLDNYSAEPNPINGTLKVTFGLDAQKPTMICINNSKNKTVYKEKLPKSKGLYTRLFDLSVYEPGNYFLIVTQGKKQNKSIITYSKNR